MNDESRAQVDLARIAHDLRAPLMPLCTAAWLLRNEFPESERVRELADIVDRQSARLARMVEELNDWGRSTGPAMARDRDVLEVSLALDMAIAAIPDCMIDPRYAGGAASTRICADMDQLQGLLRTLIGHALSRKGERPPGIDVDLEEDRIRIRVHDHGKPLEPGEREALLSHAQASPFDEGLGLRLLLASRIAEAHGGRLTVEDMGADGLVLACTLPVSS